MVANNNQRPMRVSALALPLFVTLAVAAAWPTPAFAAGGPSPPSKPMVIKGATQSEPVTPHVFEGDVRDLPKAKRWEPGDPVREVPRRVYPRPQPEGIPPRPSGPWGEPRLELKEKVSKGEEARILSTPVPNGPEGKSRGCEY